MVEAFKVFSQNSLQQHGLWSRTLIFQFRVVVVEVVEVFKNFAHNRVQQSRLRRSLTLPQVEGLTVFSPDRVPQRLPLRMLNFRLMEVCTVHAQDRVPLRFLDLNTAMMLLGVHAEVEDLMEVLKASSEDRAHQPEVELVIAGSLADSSSCLDPEVAASSSPGRRPSSAEQPLVGFRVPVSWQGHFAADASVTFSVWTGLDGFMEAYDIEAAGRG